MCYLSNHLQGPLDLRTAACTASSKYSDGWGCEKAFDQDIRIGGGNKARKNVTLCSKHLDLFTDLECMGNKTRDCGSMD
jgi:hypothetical protein